jgi:hypothetical protein
MLKSLKMTISRARLVEILEQERATLVAEFAEAREEYTLKIDAIPDTKTALLDWYVETAARLADGTYVIDDSGRMVGPQRNVLAPARPTTSSLAKERRVLDNHYYLDSREESLLAKYESVLSILSHTTEDPLRIALGDYSDLIKMHA